MTFLTENGRCVITASALCFPLRYCFNGTLLPPSLHIIDITKGSPLWHTMLSCMEFVHGTTSKARASHSFCSIQVGLGLTHGRLDQICRRWRPISTSSCRNGAVTATHQMRTALIVLS